MIGQTIGHYRIVSQLGVGGMGVVCSAEAEHGLRDKFTPLVGVEYAF